MNTSGDMLRVLTNVKTKDGSRAIGTYIPAVNLDGQANKVIETVLAGKRYIGRALVMNAWYIAANGEIIGMLFVGVPEKAYKIK